MSNRIDLTGKRFGRLLVVEYTHSNNRGEAFWKCHCDCGNTTVAMGKYLRRGRKRSCGCIGRGKHAQQLVTVLQDAEEKVDCVSRANICFDCKKSCGDCSWSAYDPVTKKLKFEPVPGWTAEKVKIKIAKAAWLDTYHITACPEFERG